jgi:IclR family transcriptional regulator, pca regulon regulatory protein
MEPRRGSYEAGWRSQRVKDSPEPRLSRSLEYGLALLECFTGERPLLGISKLADMVELSRSTTHRYATTLAMLGYLEQDEQRRYRLSRNASRPGMAVIGVIRLETPPAIAILKDLREETGHTVSVGVLDATRVLYIHRLFAHGPGQYEADLELNVGTHIPAYCTAIGKALLASLEETELRAVLADISLKQIGPNTITSQGALANQLSAVQASGIAVCDEEHAPGVRSIAAAIPLRGRPRQMAVSVTVPAQHYTVKQMITALGPYVTAAAERI